jgi:hypothetical protein
MLTTSDGLETILQAAIDYLSKEVASAARDKLLYGNYFIQYGPDVSGFIHRLDPADVVIRSDGGCVVLSSTHDSAPPLALRALVLAADMEAKAKQIDVAFADQTDILTLQSGAKSEKADALYVAADLVRQAHAKINDLGI